MGRIHDAAASYFSRQPAYRKFVQPLLHGFDVTFADDWGGKRGSVVAMFLKPEVTMAEFLGLEREMLVVYSPHKEFQARGLELHDSLMEIQRARLDPALSVIVSDDPKVRARVTSLLTSDREHAPVLALTSMELASIKSMDELRAVLVSQFNRRDVFALDSPLTRDTMFFGRESVVSTLVDQFRSGQNTGLFGLRRMGKTSVLYALDRRIRGGGLGAFTYVDMSNPTYYRSRWPRLLEHLVRAIVNDLPGETVTPVGSGIQESPRLGRVHALTKSYSEDEAARRFHDDINEIRKVLPNRKLLLALDEIENVTVGVSSASHWEQDFLPFWQTLRSLHQVSRGGFSFIVAGVNPRALEIERIGRTDNPLFATVNSYYLEPFAQPEVREMVRRLGRFMGLRVEESLVPVITDEYGGHPYLTRQACSKLAGRLKSRPATLLLSDFENQRDRLRLALEKNASQILSVLAIWDSDEYEQLVQLAKGQTGDFVAAAQRSAAFTDHLEGYGIVSDARSNPKIRIELLRSYLAKVAVPSKAEPAPANDGDAVLAELSRRRNPIERALRTTLAGGLRFRFGPKAASRLYGSLTEKRREQLAGFSYPAVWGEMYFDELRSVLDHNWEAFQEFFQEEKATVVGWMDHINRCRSDAHARSLKQEDLDFVRTCFARLEEKLGLSD
jgi:hypothetical protein